MKAEVQERLEELAVRIRKATRAVALTGAGISTESGLPDYRGPEGLWRNRRFEELASIEAFQHEPVLFWTFYRERLATLRDAAPNAAHAALARLQREGAVCGLVTQNVDGLHRAAGSEAVEVHGNLEHASCLGCGRSYTMEEAQARATDSQDLVPKCACGTPLKPGVTLFGELLPAEAVERAVCLVESADLLLVCGSSLAVFPVSRFPLVVAANGGTVAIVNRGPTEADHVADVRVDAPLGEALPALADLVLGTAGPAATRRRG